MSTTAQTKSTLKSTEFLMAAAALAIMAFGPKFGVVIDPNALAIVAGGYGISRGLAKKG